MKGRHVGQTNRGGANLEEALAYQAGDGDGLPGSNEKLIFGDVDGDGEVDLLTHREEGHVGFVQLRHSATLNAVPETMRFGGGGYGPVFAGLDGDNDLTWCFGHVQMSTPRGSKYT